MMMSNQNYAYSCNATPYRQGRNAHSAPYMNDDSNMQMQKPSFSERMTAPVPVSQMNQEQLLEWIGLTKFACVDANLYLDTHPDDAEAIRYFQEHNRLYLEAMNEYARVYGPLTVSHAQQCGTWWEWVDQPWPWQNVTCNDRQTAERRG